MLKLLPRLERFTGVSQYGSTQRGKQAVMKERRFIGSTPQPFRQEAPVTLPKLCCPGRLVLVERFTGFVWVANIVQLEIGVRRYPDGIRLHRVRS